MPAGVTADDCNDIGEDSKLNCFDAEEIDSQTECLETVDAWVTMCLGEVKNSAYSLLYSTSFVMLASASVLM